MKVIDGFLQLTYKAILLSCLFFSAALIPTVSLAAIDHARFESVLKQYVDARGFVSYEALYQDRIEFDQYIRDIASQGPTSTPQNFVSANDELAYYLNAYNALVIEGVLNRGPEKKSVWRGLISGFSFFRLMKVNLDGSETTLQSLEDNLIRARFQDPRIHAAINCASISCPRLRRHVFTAAELDEQLDASMSEFVNDETHVRVQAGVVELSAIFDWFEDDFLGFQIREGGKPTIVDYINRYRNVPIPAGLMVTYIKYNKGINAQ